MKCGHKKQQAFWDAGEIIFKPFVKLSDSKKSGWNNNKL